MKSLASDRSIVIKAADKGSCVVVWDRADYIAEAKRQLDDNAIYRKLVEKSNSMFQKLANDRIISDKEFQYFKYTLKRAGNLGKFYLLPKIHKSLENVPGRPIIFNCGTPTEKASEFLNCHLTPIMQEGAFYIKDTLY